jgi:hypothetical protein
MMACRLVLLMETVSCENHCIKSNALCMQIAELLHVVHFVSKLNEAE